MKWKSILLAACCGLLLCGCTEKNIVTPDATVAVEPDFGIKENVQIDWEQIQEDLNDEYLDGNDEYPFVKNIDFYTDESEEDMSLYMMVTVADDIPAEVAAEFGTVLMKRFNDAVAQQDFSYGNSSENSYGGFFDVYNGWIQIMPESTADNEDTWLVDDVIIRQDDYIEIQPGKASLEKMLQ